MAKSKSGKRSKLLLQIPIDAYPNLDEYLRNVPHGMTPKLVLKFLLQNLLAERLPGLSQGHSWDEFKAGLVDLRISTRGQNSEQVIKPVEGAKLNASGEKTSTPVKQQNQSTKPQPSKPISDKERNYLSSIDEGF